MRGAGGAEPEPVPIFTDDYPFDIGKAYSLRDGKDATIIATGYMVTEAIKAVDLLEKDGLDVGVLNVSTLKPIDEEAIVAAAARTGAIVTAENSQRHQRSRRRCGLRALARTCPRRW